MPRETTRRRSLPLLAAASTVLTALIAPSTALAQAQPEDLIGYEIPENTFVGPWTDPVSRFGLNPSNLAPTPDFDITTLHDSRIFAAGVELQRIENDPVDELADRHLRVLQVIDTLEAQITSFESQISEREPQVFTLLGEIRVEEEHEERLAEEIAVRERAIVEWAIQSFIGDDQPELVLGEPDTGFVEARVVSNEVRGDQRAQIALREAELVERIERRTGLATDLDVLRDEIRNLREERTVRIGHHEEAEALADQTAETYQLALHARLPDFVEGTDIPFVALNAYVIAARTLETEAPACGIHWSMLAGIGRIESIHGYFGNSTLDINGHTTEDIQGLPLDGRILSGAEFLEDGAEAPAPTGRTEDTVLVPDSPAPDAPSEERQDGSFQVDAEPQPSPEPDPQPAAEPDPQPAPEPEPQTAPEAPAPSTPPEGETPEQGEAAGDETTGDEDDETAGDEEAETADGPAPVIKTLALILDTDDGVLDGDTVYDRAVGPMQFIPTTWRLFDADGNGDGETDPQNIYDAALAAARYLCASTSTMTTAAGEQRAYFAYNHDLDYSRNVTNAGRGYRNQIIVENPEIEEDRDRYYLGVLEGSQAEERVEEVEVDPLSIDIVLLRAQLEGLRAQLQGLNLPNW